MQVFISVEAYLATRIRTLCVKYELRVQKLKNIDREEFSYS